ncbi:MAG: SH3 domain-containing protein [Clostridia bacterium]|nr:SH3 domain-containing protein [Clostridia bacterium]
MKRRILSLLTVLALLQGGRALAAAYVITAGNAHVRTGPGLDYATIGTAPDQTSLVYVNESAQDERGVIWYKVAYGESYGWVSSTVSRLDEETTASDWSSAFDALAPSTQSMVRALSRVNVRTGPGIGYEAVGVLEEGAQARYIGNSSFDAQGMLWYQIEYDSFGSYWVSSAYVELVSSQGIERFEDSAPKLTGTAVEATGGKTNIRSGPGLSYADLGTLEKGDVATYLGSYATDERGVVWYCVSVGDITGWVSSKYATLY